MYVDARLGVVPRAAASVLEAAGFGTAVAGELAVEDIIQLAKQLDFRHTAFAGNPFTHRQVVLQVNVRRGISFQHRVLVHGVVQILTTDDVGLDGADVYKKEKLKPINNQISNT